MKTAFVLGMAFELMSCAAPTALTVVSVAADGASYAASGKSLGDHALSAMSGEDCSTLSLINDGVLCKERSKTVVRVANTAPPVAAAPAATQAVPVDNSEATFMALGVFADWENADHTVVMGGFYNPLIVPLDVDAKGRENPSFWVVAGHPLAGDDGKIPVAQAKRIGFHGARTVMLCRATYRLGPCMTTYDDVPPAGETTAAIEAKVKAASSARTSLAQRVVQ